MQNKLPESSSVSITAVTTRSLLSDCVHINKHALTNLSPSSDETEQAVSVTEFVVPLGAEQEPVGGKRSKSMCTAS